MLFFTILKIIGLIILAVLCILLALILLVLFVPIRYQAGAGKQEKITADAQVSWLLRLIRGTVCFDQANTDMPLHIQFKVACFKLYDNQKPGKAPEKPPEEKTPEAAQTARPQEEKAEEKTPQTADTSQPAEQKPEEKTTEHKKTENKKEEKKQSAQPHHGGPSGPGLSDRLDELQLNLERLSRKKEKIICLFENEKNRRWLDKTLFRLKKLLLYLLPGLKKLYLHFGFDDPALTGQALGCLSLCYPLCEDRMELAPVFDGKAFDGSVRFYGNIRLYRFIAFAVPTFLTPRFFKIFKKVRCIIKK